MIRTIVVDDEPSARERYCGMINEYGPPFKVVGTFDSARNAVANWWRLKADLLFADIRMPQVTGLELIKELRRDGWTGVVIIISGYGEFSHAQEALRVGVYDYILKPVFPDDFFDLLTRIKCNLFDYDLTLSNRVLKKYGETFSAGFIRRAVEYAEQHLEETVSLSNAAEAACVSRTYLSVAFKRECGMNFVDFLHHLRVERAKELLRDESLSLTDVAEKVGWSDKSYLNRIFKRVTGYTPGEYRKAAANRLDTLDTDRSDSEA